MVYNAYAQGEESGKSQATILYSIEYCIMYYMYKPIFFIFGPKLHAIQHPHAYKTFKTRFECQMTLQCF